VLIDTRLVESLREKLRIRVLNFKVHFLESIVITFLVFVLSDVVRNFI
jgi:hypothetical protein